MASRFNIKQNDTSPAIQITCLDSDSTAIDVTGASVRFLMRDKDGTVKVTGVGEVVTPTAGVIKYDWAAADTDTSGGYEAEFEVTYADGTIETFPNVSYIRVTITDDIA